MRIERGFVVRARGRGMGREEGMNSRVIVRPRRKSDDDSIKLHIKNPLLRVWRTIFYLGCITFV